MNSDFGRSAGAPPRVTGFRIGSREGTEIQVYRRGFWVIGWKLPPPIIFSRAIIAPRLNQLLKLYPGLPRRFKAVLRTGLGPSWMLQGNGCGLSQEDGAYRRDSWVEISLNEPPTDNWLNLWRTLLRDAAFELSER
ncbi:MAG TPA: hypothetical protein VHY75_10925 [Steroidobacteraceae bacterium]|jgi:hypothetical protein|nr:hypothetical protein [Steroidobacteraceae bacterium]